VNVWPNYSAESLGDGRDIERSVTADAHLKTDVA